jgi:hypothetical protein
LILGCSIGGTLFFGIYAIATFSAAVMLAKSGAWGEAVGLCVAGVVAWLSAIQIAQTILWVRMPNKIKILLTQAILLVCAAWGVSLIDYKYSQGDMTVIPLAWIGLGTAIGLWHGFTNRPAAEEVDEANQSTRAPQDLAQPGSLRFLNFESATKWVDDEAVRLVAVPAPEGFKGEAVVAAVWEDGYWVVKSEGAVSVISVMEAWLASDEELEAVGLPFPEEPFVETALDEGVTNEILRTPDITDRPSTGINSAKRFGKFVGISLAGLVALVLIHAISAVVGSATSWSYLPLFMIFGGLFVSGAIFVPITLMPPTYQKAGNIFVLAFFVVSESLTLLYLLPEVEAIEVVTRLWLDAAIMATGIKCLNYSMPHLPLSALWSGFDDTQGS